MRRCREKVQSSPNTHAKNAASSSSSVTWLRTWCNVCFHFLGRTFKLKHLFEDHLKSNCGQIPLHKCDECGKVLSNMYTLKAHLKMHEDDSKPFVCSFCGKQCRTKNGLQHHLLIHTGERTFKCDYCDKRFFKRNEKMQHESTHTGIKPYACQCGDRFSYISNLQQHRRARKTTCGLLPLISKAFPIMDMEMMGPKEDWNVLRREWWTIWKSYSSEFVIIYWVYSCGVLYWDSRLF